MLKVNKQQIVKFWEQNQNTALIVGAALLLTIALIIVRAGSPFATFEAEGSILSGNALIKSDTAVSGGKYVEFTAGSTPPPGTLLNALDNPSAFGYPDETNTGVPAGTKLISTGTLKIDDDGVIENGTMVATRPSTGSKVWGPVTLYPDRTVIDSADISGSLHQESSLPLDVFKSKIIGPAGTTKQDAKVVFDTRKKVNWQNTHATCHDCTIEAGSFEFAVAGGLITLNRCDVSGGEDNMVLSSGVHVRDSYFHDLTRWPGSHNDSFQTVTGSNSSVIHSTILTAKKLADDGSQGGLQFDDGWYDPFNAVWMAGNPNGPVQNVTFEDNLVDGGNYTFNDNWRDNGHAVSNLVIRNNRFGRHFRFGPKALESSAEGWPYVWENNIWDDTNEVLK